jgi:hypothetical protein
MPDKEVQINFDAPGTKNNEHDLSYRTFINELPPRSSTLLLNLQI